MATNYKHTPIPNRAADGRPMSFFIVDEDGTTTTVSRDECLKRDSDGTAFPFFVDEASGRVVRLPRSEFGELIARENMRSVWREQKQTQRRAEREVSLDSAVSGDGPIKIKLPNDPMVVDQVVEDNALLAVLRAAIADLTAEEQALVFEVFWNGKTERQLAPELGLKQAKSVNKRKHKVLETLRANVALAGFAEKDSPARYANPGPVSVSK